MGKMRENPKWFYSEPVKGDVVRYGFEGSLKGKVSQDGTILHPELGKLWPETEEWKVKYQNSLSHKVSQSRIKVFYVYSMTRGRVNTRVMVIDENGACFHTMVPTSPPPRLGESFIKLRMDLTVVTLEPQTDLLNMVMEARKANPALI